MSEAVKCCFCGWEIASGKANDPRPANLDEGAACCAWCAKYRVQPCKDFIAAHLDKMNHQTIAENAKIKAEKEVMN